MKGKFNCMLKKIIDLQFSRFLLVGVINSAIGLIIMFVLYNLLNFGYWGSSSIAYIVGGAISFFLNKHFTFNNHSKDYGIVLKFIVNLIICYFVAYLLAKPAIIMAFKFYGFVNNMNLIEQIGMILGMAIFVLTNYFGQKLVVFINNSKTD